jgi:adenosine deaminase
MNGLPDLHRHLDGSIRPDTIAELARAAGKAVPSDLAFEPGMGLQAALSRFAFTLSLLQDPATVARIAHEICEDAAADGVTTLEIRFAPQLHGGAPVADIVDAALEGIAGRAGLILCALYGDPPALLDKLVDVARHGVVGLDLAGGPSKMQKWTMADYAGAFKRAARLGLGRTVHAGEGRPPDEIRFAIDALGAQRIGHGTTLLDDPGLAAVLIDRQITIEACPTSNWHTGVIDHIGAHPLPRWLEAGVPVCINTDNTLLSAVSSSEEHQRAAGIPGMTPALLERAIRCGHQACFKV